MTRDTVPYTALDSRMVSPSCTQHEVMNEFLYEANEINNTNNMTETKQRWCYNMETKLVYMYHMNA